MAIDPLFSVRQSMKWPSPALILEIIPPEGSGGIRQETILEKLEDQHGEELTKDEVKSAKAHLDRWAQEGRIQLMGGKKGGDTRYALVPSYYQTILGMVPRDWPINIKDFWRKEFAPKSMDKRHPEDMFSAGITLEHKLTEDSVQSVLDFYTNLGLVDKLDRGKNARYIRAGNKTNPKKKVPDAKRLVARCQRLWSAYYNNPTKARLMAFGKHLETMKGSSAASVKSERARGVRAYNAQFKEQGWAKPVAKKVAKRRNPSKQNPLFGNKYQGYKLDINSHPVQMGVFIARWHHPEGVRETLIEATSPDKARKKAKAWIREGAASTSVTGSVIGRGTGSWSDWTQRGSALLKGKKKKTVQASDISGPSQSAIKRDWEDAQSHLSPSRARAMGGETATVFDNPRSLRAPPRSFRQDVEGTRYDQKTGVVVVIEPKPWTATQVSDWVLQYFELGHADAANDIIRQYVTLDSGALSDARKRAVERQGFSESARGWAVANTGKPGSRRARRARKNPVETSQYYQDEIQAADGADWLVTLVPGRAPTTPSGIASYPIEVIPDELDPEGRKELLKTIDSVQLLDPKNEKMQWAVRPRRGTWRGPPGTFWRVTASPEFTRDIQYDKYFDTLQNAINELRRSNKLLIKRVNLK